MKGTVPASIVASVLVAASAIAFVASPRPAAAMSAREHQECWYLQKALDDTGMAEHQIAVELTMGDNHPDIRAYFNDLNHVHSSLGGVMQGRCPGFGH